MSPDVSLLKRVVVRRPVPGFPNYEAGSDGQVYRVGAAEPLKPYACSNRRQYLAVKIRRLPHLPRANVYVHRIVCEAFYGAPPSPRHEVRHMSGDTFDNRPQNLDWGTKADNGADRAAHGSYRRAGDTRPLPPQRPRNLPAFTS